MTARITAIVNQKGGVGKTTAAEALWAGLAKRGFKTLAVDLDPQGSLSFSAGVPAPDAAASSYGLLAGSDPAGAVARTERGDLVPASRALVGVDAVVKGVGREYRLREALAPLAEAYDHVLLDAPPSLGILTVNALAAADGVVVPCSADAFGLQGVGHLGEEIATVRKYCNAGLRVDGLLLCRHRDRVLVTRSLLPHVARMAEELGSRVFKATIREAVAVKEAQLSGKSVFDVGRSPVVGDFEAFVEEFLEVVHG